MSTARARSPIKIRSPISSSIPFRVGQPRPALDPPFLLVNNVDRAGVGAATGASADPAKKSGTSVREKCSEVVVETEKGGAVLHPSSTEARSTQAGHVRYT